MALKYHEIASIKCKKPTLNHCKVLIFYLDKNGYFSAACPFKLYFYSGSHVQLEPVSSRAAWSATTAVR
jgi:hypothetical protein